MPSQRAESQRSTSPSTFGNFSVPGTCAGAIVSIWLVVPAWMVIPIARPFLFGTVGLGCIVGMIPQWKYSKQLHLRLI